MSQPRLIALIDEAGDSGGKYGAGSSHFLAMGAVVFAMEDADSVMAVFNDARKERDHARTFRKFSENNDKDNYVLTKILSTKKVRVISVAIHKPSMAGSHLRANPQKEYQYLTKCTVERISWLARDAARGKPAADNQCKLVFSDQKTYPYSDLCAYLNKLQSGKEQYNCSIEWDYIHATVESQRHKNEDPIHLGDIAASAFHRAVEPKQHGMTDDRFIRNMRSIFYCRGGKSYGIKLFPTKEISAMCAEGEFGFLKLIP